MSLTNNKLLCVFFILFTATSAGLWEDMATRGLSYRYYFGVAPRCNMTTHPVHIFIQDYDINGTNSWSFGDCQDANHSTSVGNTLTYCCLPEQETYTLTCSDSEGSGFDSSAWVEINGVKYCNDFHDGFNKTIEVQLCEETDQNCKDDLLDWECEESEIVSLKADPLSTWAIYKESDEDFETPVCESKYTEVRETYNLHFKCRLPKNETYTLVCGNDYYYFNAVEFNEIDYCGNFWNLFSRDFFSRRYINNDKYTGISMCRADDSNCLRSQKDLAEAQEKNCLERVVAGRGYSTICPDSAEWGKCEVKCLEPQYVGSSLNMTCLHGNWYWEEDRPECRLNESLHEKEDVGISTDGQILIYVSVCLCLFGIGWVVARCRNEKEGPNEQLQNEEPNEP